MKQNVIEQLRRAIQESGQTQTAIAEGSGVDQGTISAFLRGQRGLSMDSFAALCKYLKLQLTPASK
jgi:transcriptional regulator with XRE-family HTH domain